MLDRSRVLARLQDISAKLFIDLGPMHDVARHVWERVTNDATFMHKVRSLGETPFLIPTWSDNLGDCIVIDQQVGPYRVLSVDGSQIYPDRHQGTACFLINIGTVVLSYGLEGKAVTLDSTPLVYIGEDEELFEVTPEVINCRRQELELTTGLAYSKQFQPDAAAQDAPFVFLIDGSLIFWHLESKNTNLKDTFLSRYLLTLHQLYQTKTLTAAYISLPKNKELVNLLKLELCNFNVAQSELFKDIDCLVDTSVASFFLEPYSRTIVFKNNSPICAQYPNHLQPYFFYLHVGTEIGRVEVPAWIAQDAIKVDTVARILIDQSIKGRGYPVAIAEAHEQAVVKGPDREFFYQLICKIGVEQNQRLTMSQKSMKKRGIGV
ncbi:MAG: DNA double-strand break repair nuclease NurA [Candidatus Dependentiae bacterium]|nr:DNA double-strand break repair nuclease NurA [Candidatus Dependentiae bacterium]